MITFSNLGNILYYGRFGNQLWEIASTIGISLKNNQNYAFPKWNYEKYFVGLHLPFPEDINIFHYEKYRYEGTSYKDIILDPNKNYDLEGYFQSYKYFEHCKGFIKELFTPRLDLIKKNPEGKVGIHVRRGDYLQRSDYHTNLTMDYYKKAMNLFPYREFIIFSDDITWCIKNFPDTCFLYQTSNPIMDWIVMSQCSDFIIANSSYSFWAAYLSTNPNKIVVCPQNWYVNLDSKDICPPEWIRL